MRKKYQEFNVGKAGSGSIDLATGKLTFVHQTTDAESTILPVGVSHVYQSELSNGDSVYGRGWKLSLNQSLHKVLPDDPNDTHYVYTDGSGTKHEFEEKYFYRENKEKNYYIPNTTIKIRRSDIKIDLDGRMWLLSDTTIEVFSELVTDSGLILHIRPEGFEGSEKLETRHEELIRVESEIMSLERQIEDLEIQIKQNTQPVIVGENNFKTIRDLQKEIECKSNKVERNSITDFENNVDDQNEIMRLQLETRPLLAAMNAATNEEHGDSSTIRLTSEAFQSNQAAIELIATPLDRRNWLNQQQNNDNRSEILELQEGVRDHQNKFDDESIEIVIKRWDEDLKEARIQLARRKHMYKQLINFLPVNYIIGDNILGFNEEGKLVAIFDDYDNQVSIMYEEDKIVRVIDSEERTIEFEYINNNLDHIKDFQERITYFKYDLENRLEEIIYPDETSSIFKYDDNHIMTDIMPPSRIGKKLVIDNKQRISQIINRSTTLKIDTSGIESGEEYTENLFELLYDTLNTYTIMIDSKTKEKVTYFFNEDGEVIHEHALGKFKQHFITYYESEKHEVVISEELNNDSDISEVKEQHLKWSNNPENLPSYKEKLTWQVTHLNGEGNPIKTRSSEILLPSDESVRRSVEETFIYKYFIDGRQPLLVRKNTLIITTNEHDRNLSEEYFYNKKGSLIRTVSLPDQIVEDAGYNNKGILISSVVYHRENPDKRFVEKTEINEAGQMTASFDESGKHKTTYDYIKNTNKVNRTTNPSGGHTVLGRDFATNKINSMSSTSNGERNGTTYTYTADFLTKLESGNTTFKYSYDYQGRKKAIYVNKEEKSYVTFEYSTKRHNANNGMGTVECDVVTATYASKEVYTSYTDIFGRLLSVHYKSEEQPERVIITNFYDEDKLIKTLDFKTNETILFEYDIRGNVIKQIVKGLFEDKLDQIPGQHLSISQDINISGNIDKLTYEIDNRNQTYKFDYEDELLTQINLPSGDTLKVDTDDLGRGKRNSILSNDKKIVSDELSFLQHKDHTTNLVNSHTQKIGDNSFNKTLYNYDEMGNIIETRQAGQIMVKYVYDKLNRLKRENNRILDKSYTFEYDNNGNILHKKEFPFTLETLNEGNLINYTYSDVGDKLMTFNNELFEYDILGNPVVYRNNNLKWSHLRNLESFNDIEYKYNSSNLRVYKDYQKIIDGVDTRFESRYQWANGNLISETRTSTTNAWSPSDQPIGEHVNDLAIKTTTTTLDFIYDTSNKIGFTLNGKDTYYYVRSIQGDVLKIIDILGNVVAEYAYDAWGNHKVILSIDGIAEINPIRYRSYYFDEETGLYYLKSRYYDAQVGRFINMDALRYIDPNNIGGLNLYAYCNNNPIKYIDPNGTFITIGGIIIGGIIAGIVGGAVAGGMVIAGQISSTGSLNPFNWNWREIGGTIFRQMASGFVLGIAGFLAFALGGLFITGKLALGLALGLAIGINFSAGIAAYVIRYAGTDDFHWGGMFEAGRNQAIISLVNFGTGIALGALFNNPAFNLVPFESERLRSIALWAGMKGLRPIITFPGEQLITSIINVIFSR